MTSDDGPTPPPQPRTPEDRVAPALVSAPAFFRAPYDAATWRAVAALGTGWMWHLTGGLVLWILVVVSAGLVPALGVGVPLLAASLVAARWFGGAERARIAAQTGVLILAPLPRVRARRGFWSGLWSPVRDNRAWAAALYAFLAMLISTVFFPLTAALLAGAVAAVAFVPLGQGTALAQWSGLSWPATVVGALAGAVVLVWAGAALAQYGSYLMVRLATYLLGPSAADVARARAAVAEQETRLAEAAAHTARERAVVLTESRTAAVSAADTERRRIERDLHDGAQQRLVALGVELGVARRLADKDPEHAVAALELAHREIKETLAELRDLVRGIHPAVLADRGLDAALSALAGRSPVPVRVEVTGDLAPASAAAQAAAYFVVAEALTNVAKHAGAESVRVHASLVPEDEQTRLRVIVHDDGRGGAEPSPGSGLEGLRGRVAALDGTFELDSPPGKGTRLTVEVPCAS
ncbi:sensor histidine kinase [Promicromonospora iranensis]|uniref:histidine kinase n=1 Tax=Promicromonospora iranensis TaxID=1105144 RepID=A0ABU2CQM1_9MICO|nr:sensor histidine kinase [Promicromonospora iranensis]MDR7383619.1 signal transduction histidine kinase [Promicromonospora iranensis]